MPLALISKRLLLLFCLIAPIAHGAPEERSSRRSSSSNARSSSSDSSSSRRNANRSTSRDKKREQDKAGQENKTTTTPQTEQPTPPIDIPRAALPANYDAEAQLPDWTEQDYKKLLQGKIIVGEELLDAGENFVQPPIPYQAVPDDEMASPQLNEKMLAQYLKDAGQNALIDPFNLLDEQTGMDLLGLILAVKDNSNIDLKIVINHPQIDLPIELNTPVLAKQLYNNSNAAAELKRQALVSIHPGNIELTQLAFSDDIKQAAGDLPRRAMVEQAKMAAREFDDAQSVIYALISSIAANLPELDRKLIEQDKLAANRAPEMQPPKVELNTKDPQQTQQVPKRRFSQVMAEWLQHYGKTIGMMLAALFLGIIGIIIYKRLRRYTLPAGLIDERLGAPRGAAVARSYNYRNKNLHLQRNSSLPSIISK